MIPCYNEEARLRPGEYKKFLAGNPMVDLIFVDDGSVDGTPAALELITSQSGGRAAALRQEPNQGKAQAVRRGVLEAFSRGYDLAGYWDADNATPLRLAQDLVADLERAKVEMVMGSRVNILGKRICRSDSRHYLGRLFATMASFILKRQIYDTQCGAKIFRNSEIMRHAFEAPFETGWTFDMEIIARIILRGRDVNPSVTTDSLIIEHPLDEWVDVPGSKLKASHAFGIARDLFTIYRRYHGRL